MATTIYNGLLYTTKEINRNFRIKINGIVDGKKVNKLVGVKGLIELIGVGMANKMLRRVFNGKTKPYVNCVVVSKFHSTLNNIRPGGFPEPNTNSYEFRKKKQVKRDFQIGVAVRKTQWLQTFRGFKMCMVEH